MVDKSASTYNLPAHDFIYSNVDRTRINSAADKWWSNMLAVVKLRQKGTTKVNKLPSGVFRHMLEYKFPRVLFWRYSDPVPDD